MQSMAGKNVNVKNIMSFKITKTDFDSTCDICKKEQEEMPFVVINELSHIEHRTLICSKKCFMMYNQLKKAAKEVCIGNPQEDKKDKK